MLRVPPDEDHALLAYHFDSKSNPPWDLPRSAAQMVGYRAFLCGSQDQVRREDDEMSREVLRETINTLKGLGVNISGYVPGSAVYIGGDGLLYGQPSSMTSSGYYGAH